MKKLKLIMVLLLMVSAVSAEAQLKDLKDKFLNKDKGNSSVSAEENMKLNQYEQADFLSDGTTKIFTTLWGGGRKSGSGSDCKELKYERKDWRLTISDVTREDGKVTSFTLSRSADGRSQRSYTFTPAGINKDADGFYTDATCWTTGKGYYVVIYAGGIYPITNDPYPSNDYCIMSAFGDKSANLEDLKAYTAPLVALKATSSNAQAADAEAAREEHRAKYSIEGKEVTKISIVMTSKGKLGVWDKFNFGFEATLKDGSTIKTSNIGGEGYMSDYTYSVQGAKSDIGGYVVQPQLHENKGDYIMVNVASKFNANIKAEEKIILDYHKGVKIYYDGGNGFTGPTAKPGMSLKIEAKAVKHTETGAALVQYSIYNIEGKLLSTVRVQEDQSFFVSSVGGRGSNGNNDHAYNGANGGNINLIVDPGLKNYIFNYDNNGGAGGTTNNSAYRNGRPGNPGNFSEKTQTVR